MNDNRSMKNLRDDWEEIRGPLMTRTEVLTLLREHPKIYKQFEALSEVFQEELVAFAMGVQGAKITYDPFFKFIFDPVIYKENVEDFLEAIFGEEVEILEVLPNESRRLTEDSPFLAADLLVKLKSGAIVNVEIQRVGYYFPGARCACYSSDLIMRQYSELKARRRQENKKFSYGDVKKVYTIVLMQQSTKEFHDLPEEYLHYAKQTFKTGLNMDLLQEYLLVPLDIFLDLPHNEISKLEAWLYFIGSDKMSDIKKVCEAYPEFRRLYCDVFKFRFHPKELVSMFSEALRILDQDTAQLMVDEMRKEMEEEKALHKREIEKKDAIIEKKDAQLEEKDAEIALLKAQLSKKETESNPAMAK